MPEKSRKQTPIKRVAAEHGRVLAAWGFKEFEVYHRSTSWYLGMGLVGGLLIIYAVFTANFLFAVIIILAALIIYAHSSRLPETVNCQIIEDGLVVKSSFYPYRDIKNFWIIYQPPEVKTLYFDFKSFWRPRLSIPLDNQDPVKVRKILLKYLPEDLTQENEPFSDQISRLFKL